MLHNRRTFLGKAAALGAVISVAPWRHLAAAGPDPALPLDDMLVKDYVGAAHRDLDRVRTMLDEQPLLLNASWDWGNGDFETALGAAGHVGRRDIAEFLLDKGARADLFVLTMLGETAIVKSLLERFPYLLNSYGPHGFTLLHHAQRGGEAAQNLLDFLTEKGLSETRLDLFQKK